MTCYICRLPADQAPWAYAAGWDYSPAMVAAVKHNVPSRQRAWQPAHKRWVFKEQALDAVCHLADLYCGGWVNERPDADPAARPMRLTTEVAYGRLHLRPTAPPELVTAAYKTPAKLHHPDVTGGEDETMTAINVAYAVLT